VILVNIESRRPNEHSSVDRDMHCYVQGSRFEPRTILTDRLLDLEKKKNQDQYRFAITLKKTKKNTIKFTKVLKNTFKIKILILVQFDSVRR
jgi:hypothetical protein